MAFVVNDRVQEFTSTTGTGTLTLTGSPDGFETFSSAVGNGNTTYYAISSNTTEFEVGIGTVGAGTLSRDTVISSSNSDALVNFSAGTKNVFVTLPASKTILSNDSNIVNVPGAATFAAGTVSLPSITTTGDTNTGIFFPAADTIAFSEGGAERMRITSSGNVGIGTSSPGAELNVVGNIRAEAFSTPKLQLKRTGNNAGNGYIECLGADDSVDYKIAFAEFAGAMSFDVGGSERMRINSSGNVGIGTTSPDALLSVNGVASFGDGTAAAPSIANFGDLNTGIFFPAADTIGFAEGGTETMRITSDRVGIGTTSPLAPLSVGGLLFSGELDAFPASSDSSAVIGRTGSLGSAPFNNAGAIVYRARVTSTSGRSDHIFFTGDPSTERMRINSSGAMLLGTTTAGSASAGDLVVNGGVFLGGSAAANELDDYEEGTWTPEYAPFSGDPFTSITYGFRDASYTKIGRQVTCIVAMRTSALTKGTASGAVNLTGLPFTVGTSHGDSLCSIRSQC
jgi:hypothetical protein